MAKATQTEATASAEASKETKFPLDTLRTNCMKVFGVSVSTFAGATTGLKDGEYTISEVRNTIETWLKKEVK